jgi:rhodanese-related sulfurtransferase/DNA-binding MarR family transcriptional regulator
MKGRDFKDAVFEQFARIAYAFSSPKRLEMIDVLAQGERDVDSLTKQVAMTIANTSRHLQILKNARLVESRRDGVRIFYKLADEDVFNCWKSLQSLAEKRLSEVKEITHSYLKDRECLDSISLGELWERIQKKDIIVLDVRPAEEFKKAHISGSISIPLQELKARLHEIPRDKEIVAYCRGSYCVLSPEAIILLNKAGYHAIRLDDGLPEWQNAGFPVESELETV